MISILNIFGDYTFLLETKNECKIVFKLRWFVMAMRIVIIYKRTIVELASSYMVDLYNEW